MDFSALVLSVERTRRYTRSALPDAEIRPDRQRWRRFWAAVFGGGSARGVLQVSQDSGDSPVGPVAGG